MTIDVLVFGAAAAIAQADRVRVRVDEPVTSRDVLAALDEQHPELRFAMPSARLAVNQTFAASDLPVSETDELALIALVGGG